MSERTCANILILDDEKDVIDSLGALLAGSGYAVRSALSCAEALQLLSEQLPDLILSDINMPGEDGFEFLTELRRQRIAAQVPVIFVTAKTRPEDRQACLQAGAEDFIEKPVHPERLLSSVENCLRVA